MGKIQGPERLDIKDWQFLAKGREMNEVQVMITAETLEKILDTSVSEASVLDLVMALRSLGDSRDDEKTERLTEEIERLTLSVDNLCIRIGQLHGAIMDLNYLLNKQQGGFIDTLLYP
ncbi:hypothetical protein IIY24_00370 [Candidatus Saccharibacteria bacterium]|nr:hypothetical protein [Candidatus Saccharibacteria bacterium]